MVRAERNKGRRLYKDPLLIRQMDEDRCFIFARSPDQILLFDECRFIFDVAISAILSMNLGFDHNKCTLVVNEGLNCDQLRLRDIEEPKYSPNEFVYLEMMLKEESKVFSLVDCCHDDIIFGSQLMFS